MTSSRLFYTGVFLISGCLMALQILQSRIFSVTTWYHLAFLVISIAMFGMTLAALQVHRGDEKKQRENYAGIMAKASDDLGLYIIIALMAQLFVPIIYSNVMVTMISLPILSLVTVMPFFKAGLILTMALTRSPYPVGKTYGIDLLGAAAGCLFALLLMQMLDAPSAVLFLCVLAFASSLCFAKCGQIPFKFGNARFLLFIVAGVIALNVLSPKPFVYPIWIKSRAVMQQWLAHDEWNSISRVTVFEEEENVTPFLWGPSPVMPEDTTASHYVLKIDGDAGTPITKFTGDMDEISFLEYDVTTIAYALPGIDKVGIIGVGGGRDVLTAHYFGATDITALDVNDIQISLLTEKEPFKSYAGISDLEGVKLIHSEARSWFARHEGAFDLIQMSLIDTWAATGAGAFALSENGLYTTDAWGVIMDDLNDNGVFTVSRWYVPQMKSGLERLLAVAAQTLFERGIANPRDHIMVITSDKIATLILSKSPLTQEQIGGLHDRADRFQYDILIGPDTSADHERFNKIVDAGGPEEIRSLAKHGVFDVLPTDDNRPFFFNQTRLGNPFAVLGFFYEVFYEKEERYLPGQIQATLNLYLILAFAFFMVVFAILRPLRGAIRDSDKKLVSSGTTWFLLIGLGFMLLEVALLQRMSIFLGHPVYGLSVVLFSLVLSTGLGSFLSERYSLADVKRRNGWIVGTALIAVLLSFMLGPVFGLFAEASMIVRALVCIGLIVPLGLLLGYGFPTGITLVESIDKKPTAWFWGINGAAGVMGSALAVTFNIAFGLNVTIILGAICYALLLLPSGTLAQLQKS